MADIWAEDDSVEYDSAENGLAEDCSVEDGGSAVT